MSAAQDFINSFSDVQTMPHLITKLSSLIADSNSTMKEFEDVIKMDPILVARLLRLVNSPYFGLVQKIDSISRAVAYLGMRNLHNIAVTDAIKSMFKEQEEDETIFSRKKLWLHCAAVSLCSKMIAERIFGINGDDAYLCGILHDFGLIVEEQVQRKKFHQLCNKCHSSAELVEREQQVFQTDHCAIGYLMTQGWAMPVNIQEAIRDHHTMLSEVEPTSLTGIVQIAEYLCGQLDHTVLPGMTPQISDPLLAHLQENIDEYQVLMEDFPEEMAKAHSLYGTKE